MNKAAFTPERGATQREITRDVRCPARRKRTLIYGKRMTDDNNRCDSIAAGLQIALFAV